MVRRHAEEEEVEEEEEEGEETKAEEDLSPVMSKNKDQENHSINLRFDVITVKTLVIL